MLKLVYWVSRGLVTQPTKKKTKREEEEQPTTPPYTLPSSTKQGEEGII